jgi:5'-nucleotidase
VGAAIEGAAMGCMSLAVSLETQQQYHLSYSREIDFSAAAHFTAHFARLLLAKKFPEDMRLLKLEVPSDATTSTGWEIARLTRQRYYEPVRPERAAWDVPAQVGYREAMRFEQEPHNTDAYILRKKRRVAVTPLSTDLTARVDFSALDRLLRE